MIKEEYIQSILLPGEELKEVCPNGEYYDKGSRSAKKGTLVFTTKRFLILAEIQEKAKLFHKAKTETVKIAEVQYSNIDLLRRHRVGSDDTFCCAVLKSGEQCIFNLFGEVFGPLASKFSTYSCLNIKRDNSYHN